MALKQILVHVDDDTARSAQRAAIAARLARTHDAELVGMYLVTGVAMTPSLAAMLPDDIVRARLAQSGNAQHRAERAFRDAAAKAGLAAIDWRAPAGAPLEAAIAHGRATDLIVVGQAEPGGTDVVFATDILDAAVLETARPVLVVPYVGLPPTSGEHLLVAWDGGREATRAIGDAMPLLERARKVEVLAIDTGDATDATGAPAAARLTAWLARHGVDVGAVHHDTTDVGVAAWLLSRVADSGCDLVVMGGYEHARARERVMGGATREMLEAMTVPVLMSH
jgi:nucleotide-binding universal stress UspA family protein